MIYNYLMIRFGELSTKGKNKKDFIRQLSRNISSVLKDFPNTEIETKYDHIYVKLNDEKYEDILKTLQEVSGIHSISLVLRTDDDIENIKSKSLEII